MKIAASAGSTGTLSGQAGMPQGSSSASSACSRLPWASCFARSSCSLSHSRKSENDGVKVNAWTGGLSYNRMRWPAMTNCAALSPPAGTASPSTASASPSSATTSRT